VALAQEKFDSRLLFNTGSLHSIFWKKKVKNLILPKWCDTH